MAEFHLSHLDRFMSSAVTIGHPREFAYFSYDDNRTLKPLSTESLRYYYPPSFFGAGGNVDPINLSKGFESFISRDDTVDEHLDGLLETLQVHEERLLDRFRNGEIDLGNVRVQADVITWRGMLTKLLTAPYDDMFGDFEMNATLFQDTIFIEENHPYKLADKLAQNNRPSKAGQPSQEMMQYWGYKFETISVLPKPWAECTRDQIENRDHDVVNNYAQYCSIVRTRIGKTSLVLAGEVDCVLGGKPDDPEADIPWVELKTTEGTRLYYPREAIKYERKLLRYWAQSFLLGVPHIKVGVRTADGFLSEISDLETKRIPGMVSRGQKTWNGNVCINAAAAFLDFLKKTIDGGAVWRIRRKKNSKTIEVFRTADGSTREVLTPQFVKHRETLRAMEVSAGLG